MDERVQLFEFRSSCRTMLAMPESLRSFSLGATYDTLPSLSNLYRWHIDSEPSCYLSSKTVCTTAHILGTWKVALQQEGFTYCHDPVLQAFLTPLKLSFPSSQLVRTYNTIQILLHLELKLKSNEKSSYWPFPLNYWQESCVWFQEQNGFTILNIAAQLWPDLFIFQDAKDPHNYRSHMFFHGKHEGLPPEKISKAWTIKYLHKI